MTAVVRLGARDVELADRTFGLIAAVFGERYEPRTAGDMRALLNRQTFWAFAALVDGEVVGGLTAHTLPMSTGSADEVFVYDIAVHSDHQRTGIGRRLMDAVLAAAAEAGLDTLFVPADNDDAHALDFYRSLGGSPQAVTFFEFGI